MVIGAFPIGKVAILGIKQIAKPVSNVLKFMAKNNEIFQSYLCAPIGQLINNVDTRFKLYTLNFPQPKRVRPLTKSMATAQGADLLGELFVLGIGIGLIHFEVSRSALKDKKKHETHKQERDQLKNEISALNSLVDMNDKEINEMIQLME